MKKLISVLSCAVVLTSCIEVKIEKDPTANVEGLPKEIMETMSGITVFSKQYYNDVTASLQIMHEEVSTRIDKVQTGIEKIQEGKDLLSEGLDVKTGTAASVR